MDVTSSSFVQNAHHTIRASKIQGVCTFRNENLVPRAALNNFEESTPYCDVSKTENGCRPHIDAVTIDPGHGLALFFKVIPSSRRINLLSIECCSFRILVYHSRRPSLTCDYGPVRSEGHTIGLPGSTLVTWKLVVCAEDNPASPGPAAFKNKMGHVSVGDIRTIRVQISIGVSAPMSVNVLVLVAAFLTVSDSLRCYQGQQNASLPIQFSPTECIASSMSCILTLDQASNTMTRACQISKCTVSVI